MSEDDLDILWTEPGADPYHMSRRDSQFYNRSLYNKALFSCHGKPSSLEDYEATDYNSKVIPRNKMPPGPPRD
jgi:hypothetical protein